MTFSLITLSVRTFTIAKFRIMAVSTITLNIMTFSIVILSKMIFCIMAFNIVVRAHINDNHHSNNLPGVQNKYNKRLVDTMRSGS